MTLPDGYHSVESGTALAFASDPALGWVRDVLTSMTLHESAEGSGDVQAFAGRGATFAFTPAGVSMPEPRWVARHYHRGGAIAAYLGDRYLASPRPRPWIELSASTEARVRGIATPVVVAGATYANGAFYRADIVTELVPHSVDLASVIFGERGSAADRERALLLAGRLVRRMETELVQHADLNATNILIAGPGGNEEAHVIDLDRCTVAAQNTPISRAMRRRLQRSLVKLGGRSGRPLTESAWEALRAGLEDVA